MAQNGTFWHIVRPCTAKGRLYGWGTDKNHFGSNSIYYNDLQNQKQKGRGIKKALHFHEVLYARNKT